jgi:thiol-disulfide isomerase/thioredoxin
MKSFYLGALCLFLLPSCLVAVEPELPAEAKSFAQRAKNEYRDGKFQDAVRDFSQAAKLSHDTCYPCVEGLALSKAHLGDLKESYKFADKAITMAATPAEKASAHNCRGDICVLNASTDPRKLVEAETEYRAALDILPANASEHFRLGYVLLREKKQDEGIQHLQTFISAEPTGSNANVARKLIAKPSRAGEEFAPDFSFKTAQGTAIDNRTVDGKVVVFDFWATWCPPCRASVPELRELSKQYSADKLVIVSISEDEKEAEWSDFISRKHMDWNQYHDLQGKIGETFGVHAFPTYIVMDKDGVIVKRIVGMNPQETLVHRLREQLATMMK